MVVFIKLWLYFLPVVVDDAGILYLERAIDAQSKARDLIDKQNAQSLGTFESTVLSVPPTTTDSVEII